MRRYALLVMAAMLLPVACGGSSSDEKEISDTIEGFFHALGEDTAQAYSYLAEECREEISFDDFAVRLQLSAFFAANEVRVENVEIVERDDDGIVADLDIFLVGGGEGSPPAEDALGRVRLVREDGRWRLADCENFLAPEIGVEARPGSRLWLDGGACRKSNTPPQNRAPL